MKILLATRGRKRDQHQAFGARLLGHPKENNTTSHCKHTTEMLTVCSNHVLLRFIEMQQVSIFNLLTIILINY